MRILHTSDWHLGARLCDRDRNDEHKKFLEWLKITINVEKVDILLVAGDIFDSTNPPNSADTIYYDFLCSIRETCCQAVVIIGGNHDSITKLNSPKELLRHLSVYVNGGRNESPDQDIITIKNKNEELSAIICAIPFLRERDVHTPKAGELWDEREKAISAGIKKYYDDVLDNAKNIKGDRSIPIVAMGHLFTIGSLSGAGQRDLYVGNLGSVSDDIFSKEYAYTALGHIHKPQKVANRENVRYCGSPLHMDFGEKGEKEILFIDFDNENISEIRAISIPIFRKLIRFSGTFEEIIGEMDAFIAPDSPYWCDAEVSGGDSVGDISQLLNSKAADIGFEFLRIKVLSNSKENILSSETTIEIEDLTIEEVFVKRCEKSQMNDNEINELLPLHRELIINLEKDEENQDEN